MVSPSVVGLVKVTRTSRQMRSLRRESRVFDLTIEWRNFFTLRGQIWLLNFILKFIEGVFGAPDFLKIAVSSLVRAIRYEVWRSSVVKLVSMPSSRSAGRC